MEVKTIDGRSIHLEPTSSDAKLRAHHEAAAKSEKRAAAIDDKLRREKARRDAALPTQGQRMEHGIEGLRRLGEKMDRQGDRRGPEILKIVQAAVDLLHEYSTLTRELETTAVDPLAVAIAASAKELRKTLPKSFPTENDALLFARKLPLAKARLASTRAADARGHLGRDRNKIAADFWAAIQRGAVRAGLGTDDRELDRLVNIGML